MLCDSTRLALAEWFHQSDRRFGDLSEHSIRCRPADNSNRLRIRRISARLDGPAPHIVADPPPVTAERSGNTRVSAFPRGTAAGKGSHLCWRCRPQKADRVLRKLTRRLLGPYLGNAPFMFGAPLAYPPGHFYSPICDPVALTRHYRDPDTTPPPDTLPGIDLAHDA